VSLQNSSVPQEWRTHCGIPIFKTGDRSVMLLILIKSQVQSSTAIKADMLQQVRIRAVTRAL